MWDLINGGAYETLRGEPTLFKPFVRTQLHAFFVAFLPLTSVMAINVVTRRRPGLSERGVSGSTLVEVVLLAIPFIAALTIPMAVFVAVLWVVSRHAALRTDAGDNVTPRNSRRLLAKVFKSSLVFGAIMMVLTSQVIPRSSFCLSTILAGETIRVSDRAMNISELRQAARISANETTVDARARTASY